MMESHLLHWIAKDHPVEKDPKNDVPHPPSSPASRPLSMASSDEQSLNSILPEHAESHKDDEEMVITKNSEGDEEEVVIIKELESDEEETVITKETEGVKEEMVITKKPEWEIMVTCTYEENIQSEAVPAGVKLNSLCGNFTTIESTAPGAFHPPVTENFQKYESVPDFGAPTATPAQNPVQRMQALEARREYSFRKDMTYDLDPFQPVLRFDDGSELPLEDLRPSKPPGMCMRGWQRLGKAFWETIGCGRITWPDPSAIRFDRCLGKAVWASNGQPVLGPGVWNDSRELLWFICGFDYVYGPFPYDVWHVLEELSAEVSG